MRHVAFGSPTHQRKPDGDAEQQPAAAAIYNARLYEYATIYSTELENNAKKLDETRKALEESQRRSPGSSHN